MSEQNMDIWVRMYEEQIRHARHHDALRAQATNLIVVMSGGALAFLASGHASSKDSAVLGAFIIVINGYGFLMSLKHYERSRQHVAVAAEYRDEVSVAAHLNGKALNEARAKAKSEHHQRFPIFRNVRAYALWAGLHFVLTVLGAWFLL